jgi:hypothetical protein
MIDLNDLDKLMVLQSITILLVVALGWIILSRRA